MKGWQLKLWDEGGESFLRQTFPEMQLWQPFFLAVGTRLRESGKTHQNPLDLIYGLWPAADLSERTPPLLPDFSSSIWKIQKSSPISLFPRDEKSLFFLAVWEAKKVIYTAYYQHSEGIGEAIGRKVEELRQTRNLEWSRPSQLYYEVIPVDIPETVTPHPKDMVCFSALPGWSPEHRKYLEERKRTLQFPR